MPGVVGVSTESSRFTYCRIISLAVMIAATLVLTPAQGFGQSTLESDWRAELSSAAWYLTDNGLAPGIGVAVVVGDWVVYSGGFGYADRASGRGATGDTPFYIASTTKSLTALAAVLGAAHGELDLAEPMTRYLPAARLPAGVERDQIKVRDLAGLTHGLSGMGARRLPYGVLRGVHDGGAARPPALP